MIEQVEAARHPSSSFMSQQPQLVKYSEKDLANRIVFRRLLIAYVGTSSAAYERALTFSYHGCRVGRGWCLVQGS